MPQQVRFSDKEVETLKALFPDLDSLKLLRKYLLNLALTKEEVTRVTALWSSQAAQDAIRTVALPVPTGNEQIGAGYDYLNNVSVEEHDLDYLEMRTEGFVTAIKYVDSRITGLSDVKASTSDPKKWLTSVVLDPSCNPLPSKKQLSSTSTGAMSITDAGIDMISILDQLIIIKSVEGSLVGLQALVLTPVETPEAKAKRVKADSTQ